MKEIILKVPEKEYKFFMKLIQSLGFVKVEEKKNGDSPEDIKRNLENGFREMKLIKEGKKEGKSFNSFLDEI